MFAHLLAERAHVLQPCQAVPRAEPKLRLDQAGEEPGPRATDQGFVLLVASSDANSASVAPFGGTRAVFTPDPLAIGFPTAGDPVLVDISASVTTNGMSARLYKAKQRFAYRWLLDANGHATDDPAALYTEFADQRPTWNSNHCRARCVTRLQAHDRHRPLPFDACQAQGHDPA